MHMQRFRSSCGRGSLWWCRECEGGVVVRGKELEGVEGKARPVWALEGLSWQSPRASPPRPHNPNHTHHHDRRSCIPCRRQPLAGAQHFSLDRRRHHRVSGGRGSLCEELVRGRQHPLALLQLPARGYTTCAGSEEGHIILLQLV